MFTYSMHSKIHMHSNFLSKLYAFSHHIGREFDNNIPVKVRHNRLQIFAECLFTHKSRSLNLSTTNAKEWRTADVHGSRHWNFKSIFDSWTLNCHMFGIMSLKLTQFFILFKFIRPSVDNTHQHWIQFLHIVSKRIFFSKRRIMNSADCSVCVRNKSSVFRWFGEISRYK